MDQVGAVAGCVGVERDRTLHARRQLGGQPIQRLLPPGRQRRHLEHAGVRAVVADEPQRGLAGDVQCGGDHSLGAGRGEVEILQLRLEGARQFVELPVQFQPARQCPVDDRGALVVDDGGALAVR